VLNPGVGQQAIHIAVVADEPFVPHIEVLMVSLLAHHEASELHLHWFHGDLQQATKMRIVEWTRVAGLRVDFRDYRPAILGQRGSIDRGIHFVRVTIPEILTDLERFIYLDGDTVVADSLRSLWATDMRGQALAGVRDHWVGSQSFFEDSPDTPQEKHAFYTGDTYINTGVLLIDCRRWRKASLTESILSRLDQQSDLSFLDQDAINIECRDHLHLLDPRWNVHAGIFELAFSGVLPPGTSRQAFQRACAWPGVVHYAGTNKPWGPPSTWWPMTPHYYRYQKKSHWRTRLSLPARLRISWLTFLHWLQRFPRLYAKLRGISNLRGSRADT
jgi:lipopolysaccharide biosynthesis glycosyltransferase